MMALLVQQEAEAPMRRLAARAGLPDELTGHPPLGLCVRSVLPGQHKLHSFPTITRARSQASYSPTSAGVPLVMRMSSA
jgi:hypothetical protein